MPKANPTVAVLAAASNSPAAGFRMTCPVCSDLLPARRRRRQRTLQVRVSDDGRINWRCNSCGFAQGKINGNA